MLWCDILRFLFVSFVVVVNQAIIEFVALERNIYKIFKNKCIKYLKIKHQGEYNKVESNHSKSYYLNSY